MPEDPKAALKAAIRDLKPFYRGDPGDWPRTLWRICRAGLVSHQTETLRFGGELGISREDVINLQRLYHAVNGWFYYSQFIPMDEWLKTEGE